MFLQCAYSVHHNEERSYPTEIYQTNGSVLTIEEFTPIIQSILENSQCHSDWRDVDQLIIDKWIETHFESLMLWLFGNRDFEITIEAPIDPDGYELNDVFLFNLFEEGQPRNIGCNIPDGDKSDGLWVQATDITAEILIEQEAVKHMSLDDLTLQYVLLKRGNIPV